MRRTPLTRKTRLKPVNPRRRAQLFVTHFHSEAFVRFVHGLPCSVPRCGNENIQAAHVLHSRGAGGGPDSVAPLCGYHHHLQGSMGVKSFSQVFGVDLLDAAWRTWQTWARRLLRDSL